jgi:hypothetical protein
MSKADRERLNIAKTFEQKLSGSLLVVDKDLKTE